MAEEALQELVRKNDHAERSQRQVGQVVGPSLRVGPLARLRCGLLVTIHGHRVLWVGQTGLGRGSVAKLVCVQDEARNGGEVNVSRLVAEDEEERLGQADNLVLGQVAVRVLVVQLKEPLDRLEQVGRHDAVKTHDYVLERERAKLLRVPHEE